MFLLCRINKEPKSNLDSTLTLDPPNFIETQIARCSQCPQMPPKTKNTFLNLNTDSNTLEGFNIPKNTSFNRFQDPKQIFCTQTHFYPSTRPILQSFSDRTLYNISKNHVSFLWTKCIETRNLSMFYD